MQPPSGNRRGLFFVQIVYKIFGLKQKNVEKNFYYDILKSKMIPFWYLAEKGREAKRWSKQKNAVQQGLF